MRPLARLGLLASALAWPARAEAHLLVTGFGPAYDGALHLLTSLEDVAPIVAAGLYAGRLGPAASRLAVMALPAAWAAGGLLALIGLGFSPIMGAAAAALSLLAIGLLLAADIRLSPPVVALLAAALGFSRGLADLKGSSSGPGWIQGCGMGVAAGVALALAASLTLPVSRPWLRIAVRIAGSWAAAVGLLLGGWLLRYGARAL